MENNSLFPLKYRLRKTGDAVEIVAWETIDKGARNEGDWVSYIDAFGKEHFKEHLTLEWDFMIESPFDSMMSKYEPMKLPEFDPWEAYRREAAKDVLCAMNCAPWPYMKSLQEAVRDAIEQADELIRQLKQD